MSTPHPMHYCNRCGGHLERIVPVGDHMLRHICRACAHVHYINPKPIVGCVVEHDGKVLMCRRAIEPRHGRWTLPAGFMEMGETSAAGAARETREEANAEAVGLELFTLINVTYIGQLYLFYRARLSEPEFGPTHESLDVRLMDEGDIPWDELAFPTVRMTLRDYFADRARGRFELHQHDLTEPPIIKR